MDGQAVYRIQSEMKTRALFRVYRFQRQEETYLNPITLSPVRFRNQLRDQKYRATVTVDFERKPQNMKKSHARSRNRLKNARQRS